MSGACLGRRTDSSERTGGPLDTGIALVCALAAGSGLLLLLGARILGSRQRVERSGPDAALSASLSGPRGAERAQRPPIADLVVAERPAATEDADPAPGGGRKAAASRPAPALERGAQSRVQAAYLSVLRRPQYLWSPTVNAWAREFRSYPDLRAIDDRYTKDGDAMAFLSDMVRSPNFQAMAARYLVQADVRAFLTDLLRQPEIASSVPALAQDDGLKGAARTLES
ncbi:MAG TPA: hypothetical protein VNI01_01930, partial [Elusimicrobiota bacterium]|nr:hypothetical protein [Elusimicrobiota bacterium]